LLDCILHDILRSKPGCTSEQICPRYWQRPLAEQALRCATGFVKNRRSGRRIPQNDTGADLVGNSRKSWAYVLNGHKYEQN
jgi:hypothetical protein